MLREMAVSFRLLDPSVIADITETYLSRARAAGDSARGVDISSDRVTTVGKEMSRAKTAVGRDSKFLLRRVLGY